ncbi:MAG TPA: HmuY family protein [Chitinophagales bacterium]|nr:HmuY family protein [Chitinophagales bacterium]
MKEEDPVTPPDFQGNVETAQIPMGNNYEKQFFFDLETNQIVSSNYKKDWDLGFECGLEGYHIILNSSKLMFAWNTETTDFGTITGIEGAVWKWDAASGNLDSTAIGEWGDYTDGNVNSYNKVYIIDRGKDATGTGYGYKKIVFESLKENQYTFRWANLDGSGEDTFLIKKDNDYSFMYFSFDNGGERKNIAPEKNKWDLVFTQYTHIFSESPDNIPQPDTLIPYIVTGVLQNHYNVAAAEFSSKPFHDITLEDALNVALNEQDIDVIGYDWKFFNFNQVSYTVLSSRNYIVRDTDGYLYKLHFVDFYSSTGEKGYPKFEFQRL